MTHVNLWRQHPWLAPLLGVTLILGLFLGFVSLSEPGRFFDPPQPDTLLYAQYARAIAEAHPYQCQAGDGYSTGSTSHLYPLVLALPGMLGGAASTFFVWSFILNLLCYLAIVVLSGLALRRLAPAAMALGTTLVALCGPLAFACLQQSDMGLFTMLVMGLFVALLASRLLWAGTLLMLVVWCRPEGLVLAGLLFVCVLAAPGWPRRRALFVLGGWGLLHAAGVLMLNLALTGSPSFQSVAAKGHFTTSSFAGAVLATLNDLGILLREFVLGLPTAGRQSYLLPLISGLLLLTAFGLRLVARESRTRLVDRWIALSLLAGIGLMATSGWQGFNYDRHLSWEFPFLAIYAALGLAALAERWPALGASWRLVACALIAYEAVMAPLYAAQFAEALQQTTMQDAFISSINDALPAGQQVGVPNNGGAVTFLMPGRHVTHIGGYLSPEFVTGNESLASIEVLRHHPDLRFDVWLLSREKAELPVLKTFLGPLLAADTSYFPTRAALVCYQADWSTLTVPVRPFSSAAVKAIEGMTLVDRLDVGFLPEERAHDYRPFTRLGHTAFRVGVDTRLAGSHRVTEAGRVAIGSETFRVRAKPHLPLRLVLRTAAELPVDVCTFDVTYPATPIAFNPDSQLNLLVDGQHVGTYEASLGTNASSWTELVFDLPAASITHTRPEITVAGDHIAMCYWFYQPATRAP